MAALRAVGLSPSIKEAWGLWIAVIIAAGSNLIASSALGLGDAEALYYCYGQNPSLAYLDHPPMIGWLLWVSTTVFSSSVMSVRIVSLLASVLCLVFCFLYSAEMFGRRAASWAVLVLCATPVISIGLTGATPDAPLAAVVPAYLWQLHRGIRLGGELGLWHRFGRPVVLGALLGLAFLSKYTGVLLAIGTFWVLMTPTGRLWWRRPGLWLGIGVAMAMAAPVVYWNLNHGWAGIYHRLVWTQQGAGVSLKNLGALLGGQLLYMGPFALLLLFQGLRRALADPDVRSHGMFALRMAAPILILTYLLVVWSDVAEPHWPVPGYLPLFPLVGWAVERGLVRLWISRAALAYGGFALLSAHVLVISPLLPRYTDSSEYRPEYDLGNEMRGWPLVAEALRGSAPAERPVLAAFYTQCSQLRFALRQAGDPPVFCVSSEVDDFDLWDEPFVLPAGGAFFVTDNRFNHDPRNFFPLSDTNLWKTVEVRRGGRWVRRFFIYDVRSGDAERLRLGASPNRMKTNGSE